MRCSSAGRYISAHAARSGTNARTCDSRRHCDGGGADRGRPAIRRQGIYFAMITLALAQNDVLLPYRRRSPWGGRHSKLSRGRLFGIIDLADQTNICHCAGYFPDVLSLIYHHQFAVAGPQGHSRERAAVPGSAIRLCYKLMAFVLSATFASVASATKALVFQLASLTDVDWPMSGEVVDDPGRRTWNRVWAGGRAFFMVSLRPSLPSANGCFKA